MIWLLYRFFRLFCWLYGPLAVWESWQEAREGESHGRR
jgi:hypothetical protein